MKSVELEVRLSYWKDTTREVILSCRHECPIDMRYILVPCIFKLQEWL